MLRSPVAAYPLTVCIRRMFPALFCAAVLLGSVSAQQSQGRTNPVHFSGTVSDGSVTTADATAAANSVNVTFAIYRMQTGGAPLWLETQTVKVDMNGRYDVLLGSATPGGLPSNLFSDHEARWLGVQVEGKSEQPRVRMARSATRPVEAREHEPQHDQQRDQSLNQQQDQQVNQQQDQRVKPRDQWQDGEPTDQSPPQYNPL